MRSYLSTNETGPGPVGLSRVHDVDTERLNNIYDAFNGCKYAGERHVCPNIAWIKTQEV